MNIGKLSKLLALASSSNEGEATTALKMARAMLHKGGMDFVDLAGLLQDAGDRADLEEQIAALRRENRFLRRERTKPGSPSAREPLAAAVSELKRQLTSEKVARRAAEAESARLTEKVTQLEGMWRRSSQRRATTAAELRNAQADIQGLTTRLRQLELANRRLTAKFEAAMRRAEEMLAQVNSMAGRHGYGRRSTAPAHPA